MKGAIRKIREQGLRYGGLLALAVGLFLFLKEASLGLDLFEFGDETEKFVAAQMIHAGQRLYRDIFAHHGPVPYLIAHLYTLLVSRNDYSSIRIVQAMLALLCAAALYCTPVLRTTAARAWSAGGFLLLLSSVWIVQGMHMVLYQQIGGFLLTIAFLHLVIPLFFDVKPNRYWGAASGFAVVASCFCAYAFGPSAVLLTLAALILLVATVERREWSQVAFPFVLGVLLGVVAIGSWMLLYADVKGFFVYHFYFNQKIYTLFFRFSPADVLRNFSLSLAPEVVIHTLVLPLFAGWSIFLAASSCALGSARVILARFLAWILVLAAISFMNPRGGNGFHDNGFLIVNFALFILGCGIFLQRVEEKGLLARSLGAAGCLLLPFLLLGQVTPAVLSSPNGISKGEWRNHRAAIKPEEGGRYELVRSLTSKERDFLALVFNPIHYIKADRLPASGQYYYLPWQAAYNWKPLPGYRIDICQDIQDRAPAVILFDNWKVRGLIHLEQYQPCILSRIRENYVPLGRNSELFARRDLIAGETGAEQDSAGAAMMSPPLSAASPIPLRMTPGHQRQRAGLKRIGVMFAASNPRRGSAELRLQGPGGEAFTQRFSLEDLVDGSYHSFDLDAKVYTTGEIVTPSGGGISTRESRTEKGEALTCLTYEYADGKRGFTPGCPLY